jgi:hypothetical protein
MNGDSLNNEFDYPLQWIEESRSSRVFFANLLHRVNLALTGKPYRNTYQDELASNLSKVTDTGRREKLKKFCGEMPEGRSFTLKKAVDNRTAQMSTGVDSYEYKLDDPFMVIEDNTEELLARKCEQDYTLSHLDLMASTFSHDLTCNGIVAVDIKYDPIEDKNIIKRINPKNIFFDTKYSSTGQERFRGYGEMVSWSKLKEMLNTSPNEKINLDIIAPDTDIFTTSGDKTEINKQVKVHGRKIRSLNGLDLYVSTMNTLASSPSLAGGLTEGMEDYKHDLYSCYNLSYYQSRAILPEAKTKSGYGGDDVELITMYDLERGIRFQIINRRFVISANSKSFSRKILMTTTDPMTDELVKKVIDFKLDCPLKFKMELVKNKDIVSYPLSDVMMLLDLHDELCGWEAKRAHVAKILSILRITANSADADELKGVLNIMGVVLDEIQGDIATIQFPYDFSPIDSQIAKLEKEIKETLHGYDQFDAMQMMGDRASAAESGMAQGAMAQGLATHQNAIMSLYADIARQCIANRVAYSPKQSFEVANHGMSDLLTLEQMALSATITVKSKLAKRVHDKSLAVNALTLLGTFKDMLTEEGSAYLIAQALYDQVPRPLVKNFLKQDNQKEVALAQAMAQNQANALAQNQANYEQNPEIYEAMNAVDQNPEMAEQATMALSGELNQGAGQPEQDEQLPPELLEMLSQDGAMKTNLDGLTEESGSMFANPNGME